MDRPVRRRRTTVLTVDAGPGHRVPARFYTLVVGDRTAEAVHAELLVPDGAELRPAHREPPDLDQAA
ncbi:MAG TPA: hypothetical protein VFV67_02255 [Actinophytocola sp.]|uniref:hypothetical protein n=1 Tax=Actinophytocola sp. TaxID=1872138 RepID=UPI002DBA83D8|nr:hypothetical protein [Actinophytocola sp.]HEU5469448.1 hypothetical protein [Actinophytocola sp.]